MAKFFGIPFAATGTKNPVPNAAPADGSVSYASGWGVDYERNPVTDPEAKLLPRPEFNQIIFDITDAVGAIQRRGIPGFITAADNNGTAFAYEIGAIVRYQNKNWVSQIANNTQLPAQGAAWRELNAVVASDIAASQAEADAGTVTDKFISPGTLRGGVRNTVLTGLSTVSAAAVVATDTVLVALGKLQRRTADLDTSRLKSVVGGTNISVDNTDPLNPVISAPGSDVPGAPVKSNPIVWGDLAVITDSEDGNTLKRATFLNIRNVLKTYFDTVYTAVGNWLPLSGGTLSGDLISTSANSLRLAYGSGASLILRKDDTDFYALISDTPDGTFNTLRPFRINLATGNVTLNHDLTVGNQIYMGSSGQIATDGNIKGTRWGGGWLYDFLMSANTLLGAYAYPRRSDGGKLVFNWSGQGGQPTWLWGGADGTNMYVYNPSNFSVNYANSTWNSERLQGWGIAGIQNDAQTRANDRGYWRTRDYLMAEHVPVGGYVLAQSTSAIGAGGTIAGTSLRWASSGGGSGAGSNAISYGTWQASGSAGPNGGGNNVPLATTVFKRVG